MSAYRATVCFASLAIAYIVAVNDVRAGQIGPTDERAPLGARTLPGGPSPAELENDYGLDSAFYARVRQITGAVDCTAVGGGYSSATLINRDLILMNAHALRTSPGRCPNMNLMSLADLSQCKFRTFAGEARELDGDTYLTKNSVWLFKSACNAPREAGMTETARDIIAVRLKSEIPVAREMFYPDLFRPGNTPPKGSYILGITGDQHAPDATYTWDLKKAQEVLCRVGWSRPGFFSFMTDCDMDQGASGGLNFSLKAGSPPVPVGIFVGFVNGRPQGSAFDANSMYSLTVPLENLQTHDAEALLR